MKIEGIQRVVFAVNDLEKARERFSELLGVSFIDHGVHEEFGLQAMVSEDWTVELITPVGPNSPVTSYLESRGEGIFGFSVYVKDIEDTRADVTAKGYRFTTDVLDFGPVDNWKVFKEMGLDPNEAYGAHIVFVQAEPK
ncbi:VOC family protein [Chloroflexota bacterium]